MAADGARFRVRAPRAHSLWLCLFDGEIEQRVAMDRDGDDFAVNVEGLEIGQLYGYRADGEWNPDAGLYFDPAKLLVDPWAIQLDRPFQQSPMLARYGVDTSSIVPRAVMAEDLIPASGAAPQFVPGGLVYEVNVRSFTMLHPDVPAEQRGTIAALAHPAVIEHLKTIGVDAVELMPVMPWMDEIHLAPLGLTNAWGYNPVTFMALDPRLAPRGIADLREASDALHAAGISLFLDMVYNHSGESGAEGPVISLRGLDDRFYAHADDGSLINDSGTGNILNFGYEPVRELMLESLRHFVKHGGVDGFRFDLAPVIARSPGFEPDAPIFNAIANDPLLRDRVMIAEPWDIGPGGYQLGQFPDDWLEWNDRYRDDIRGFWRGSGSLGGLAARVSGSSDLFGETRTRSVNFIAAHDGFTLADLVAYGERHNEANGENNRDGHSDNYSWNNGVEGPSDDPDVNGRRDGDVRALLSTLFASRGTIMLTAGDEFGRTQHGNNNAYAQDNPDFWIDWANRNLDLEAHVAWLAKWRRDHPALADPRLRHDILWLRLDEQPMREDDWHDPGTPGCIMRIPNDHGPMIDVRFDRVGRLCTLTETLPA